MSVNLPTKNLSWKDHPKSYANNLPGISIRTLKCSDEFVEEFLYPTHMRTKRFEIK